LTEWAECRPSFPADIRQTEIQMRRLILWNMVSLEGFFEGPHSREIDWHPYGWGEELERISLEQLNSADTLIFGRKTYQGTADYWSSAKGKIAE
jgi:dihydrofolate reductase